MSDVFDKIIKREIPADIIYETDKSIAFLDRNPIRDGHTLVVPKIPEPGSYIFDMSEKAYLELWSEAKKVAKILEEKLGKNLNLERIAVLVEGLEVAHVHIHLIPLYKGQEGFISTHFSEIPIEEVKKIILE